MLRLERYQHKTPSINDTRIATKPEVEDMLSTVFSKTFEPPLAEKEYIKSRVKKATSMPMTILFQSVSDIVKYFTKNEVYIFYFIHIAILHCNFTV